MNNLKYLLIIILIIAPHYNIWADISIIPRPSNMKVLDGAFVFSQTTVILFEGSEANSVAQYLSDYLLKSTGIKTEVRSFDNNKKQKGSVLITKEGKSIKDDDESYGLAVNPDGIVIKAQSRKGMFYAVQSLLQLMPTEVFWNGHQEKNVWPMSIPCVEISDSPAMPWRGYMLDVSRHFFSKETILRQIDLLALYKINRFHLHLTDDQGWRVEIKKYPKLTTIGAWQILENGEKQGGFYTQQELREIVEYAKQREVMIIPEIDMPGHSLAVIAAYPELSCRGLPVAVRTTSGVSPDNMCPSNEKVYEFISDIFDEIIEIFPAPYIHIGGDEAQKKHWLNCPKCTSKAGVTINPSESKDRQKIFALQAEFVGRVNDIIKQKGKTMIGWDEIIDYEAIDGIQGAVVQSWRSSYPGLKAAAKGHKVILSPATTFYVDYPNARRPIERIYNSVIIDRYWPNYFDIENIMGVELPLWSETVKDQLTIDYMTWPRLLALAELGWTNIEMRSYNDFEFRLKANEKRLDRLGVNYQKLDGEELAFRIRPEDMPENEIIEYDLTGVIDKHGKWEVNFVYEGGRQGLAMSGFEIVQGNKIIARCDKDIVLGWRDKSPVNTLDIREIDLNAKHVFRIKLHRNPELKGTSLDCFVSVWFTSK